MYHRTPGDVMGQQFTMGCKTPTILGTLSHGIWLSHGEIGMQGNAHG